MKMRKIASQNNSKYFVDAKFPQNFNGKVDEKK